MLRHLALFGLMALAFAFVLMPVNTYRATDGGGSPMGIEQAPMGIETQPMGIEQGTEEGFILGAGTGSGSQIMGVQDNPFGVQDFPKILGTMEG
ncbi:MAG: hypothetical protein V1717_02335 [Candidatus Micrarchaeota archaeon]